MRHEHLPWSHEDRDLHEAFQRGQSGFTGTVFALQGKQLIEITMPHAFRSRDWLVTLGSMTAGDAVMPPVAGVPINNQVATFIQPGSVPPPELAAYDISGIYLRVTFGTGNANDTAYVSYPFGGGSFCLHGGMVRVEMPSGFAASVPNPHMFPPTLKGFISPNGRRGGGLMPPTLVANVKVFRTAAAGVAGINYWAPPRAVGYRLYTLVDVDAQAAPQPNMRFVVEQVRWLGSVPTARYALDGTNVDVYRGNSNVLDESIDGATAQQRATGIAQDWRHLMPGAVGIKVFVPNFPAAGDTVDTPVGVEWVLDLG